MAAENFFARWAKPKPLADQASAAVPQQDPLVPVEPVPPPAAPTMDDVAGLTRDSDYAPFMARGVDQMVQRGAMKKLFADPHFNLMDGLDIYIGDYNTPDPMPAAMLALLEHAKGVLDPVSMFEKPVMQLVSPLQLDSKLEAETETELAPEPSALDSSTEPLLERDDSSTQPLLEPVSPDAELDARIDASPSKPLPDTDEHTIQSL
jgi:hypothetical protein